MKSYLPFLLLLLYSCKQQESKIVVAPDSLAVKDTVNQAPLVTKNGVIYENQSFRDVKVEKNAVGSYRIKGEAQVFEAAFSWSLEDGHKELQTGHVTANAGAPEWGKFSFIVEPQKKDHDTTSILHIVLFEVSAKDGSRQHELPILLD